MNKPRTLEDLILEQITPTKGIECLSEGRSHDHYVGIKANNTNDGFILTFRKPDQEQPEKEIDRRIEGFSEEIVHWCDGDLSKWTFKEFPSEGAEK